MLKIALVCFNQPCVIQLNKPCAVLLVNKAEGVLRISDHAMTLPDGRALLLRDDQYIRLDGGMLIGYLIEFQQVLLDLFLFQYAAHRRKGLFEQKGAPSFADSGLGSSSFTMCLIGQLIFELEQGTSVFIFRHLLFLLLRQLNRSAEQRDNVVSEQERLAIELPAMIDEYFLVERSIGFYAARLGLKERRLNNMAYLLFGKRFFELLMQRLLTEADLMLLENTLSIKAIAYELGFSHQGHFTTYYQRYKGITPTVFRQQA